MGAAPPPALALIVAMDRRRVIGRAGALPWRLPDDLRRFKTLTTGHAVVMGRKTYESIGRPLPSRRNVVVTRQPGYAAPGAEVAHSLEEALALASPESRVGSRDAGDGVGETSGHAPHAPGATVFVIGGGELYAQAVPLAGRLYVTHVETTVPDGDARFPEIDPAVWREVAREAHPADARHPFPFSYVTYDRVAPEATNDRAHPAPGDDRADRAPRSSPAPPSP